MLPNGLRHGVVQHRRRRCLAAVGFVALCLMWWILWLRLEQLDSASSESTTTLPYVVIRATEPNRAPLSEALLGTTAVNFPSAPPKSPLSPLRDDAGDLPLGVQRLPSWLDLVRDSNVSTNRWRVTCNATEPRDISHESGQLAFLGRYFDKPTHARENAALLAKDGVFFIPELSSSPLWSHFAIPRAEYGAQRIANVLVENTKRRAEVEEIISTALKKGACWRRRRSIAHGTTNHRLHLLTSANDSPKQALESVVYHLLLGFDRVTILDTSSGRRWPTPPLSDYLEPFVSLGLVQLVAPRQFAAKLSNIGGYDPSRSDHPNVFTAFVETMAQATLSWAQRDGVAEPLLLVLCDVSEYLVLTHSAPRHSPAVSCVDDQLAHLYDNDSGPMRRRRLIVIPRAVIGQDEHFDSSRTPFERMSFATGSTRELQLPFVVSTQPDTETSGTKLQLEASDEFKRFRDNRRAWLLLDHGALFTPSSLHLFLAAADHSEDIDACVLFDHVPYQNQHRHYFPSSCFPSSGPSTDVERIGMRVVRMSCTSQSCMERFLDECYRPEDEDPRTARRSVRGHQTRLPEQTDPRNSSSETSATTALRVVNFKRLPRFHKNVVDDLPEQRSLAKNGFLRLHDEMLALLRFPREEMGRRRRVALRDPDPPILPELRKILLPFTKWGSNCLALRDTAERDGRGLAAVVLDNITNRNLVSGCVELAHEVPLHRVNRSVFERVIRDNDALLTAQTRSANGSHHEPPLLLSSVHVNGHQPQRYVLPNVTFCALVRNRAKLTLEWVLYHRLFGVSRFVIYDDHSIDGLREALQPLVDAGLVSFLNVSLYLFYYRFQHQVVKGPQFAVYSACVDVERERARREQHATPPWIGFIDPDEFVVLNATRRNTLGWEALDIPSLVRHVVESKRVAVAHDPPVGGIALQWRYLEPMPGDFFDNVGTQFERVGFHTGVPDKVQRIKVIVRSDLIRGMSSAHMVDLADSALTVFPSGEVARSGWYTGNSTLVQRAGFLAHFHVRSLVAWLQKFLDGFSSNSNMIWAFDANMYAGMWHNTANTHRDEGGHTKENYRNWMALPTMRDRFRWLQLMLAT